MDGRPGDRGALAGREDQTMKDWIRPIVWVAIGTPLLLLYLGDPQLFDSRLREK